MRWVRSRKLLPKIVDLTTMSLPPNSNIVLIGLMGAGKTTAGAALAKRLGKTFIDLDHALEAHTGVSINTIFELEGETHFRDRETATLREFSGRTNMVLSTGGGAVLRAENRQILRAMGIVVYLHVLPEVSYHRIRRSRDRPLLKTADPLQRLRTLYEERNALYREIAHHVVESDREQCAHVVQAVLLSLKS
jgi:shikimate kinase